MKKIVFSLIIAYCFNSSAESMHRIGEQPPVPLDNISTIMAEWQAEREATRAYIDKYPLNCFTSRNPNTTAVVDGKIIFVDADGNAIDTSGFKTLIRLSDDIYAKFPPTWYKSDSKPDDIFINNEQECIDARASFMDENDFNYELLTYIGSHPKMILNPGQIAFLRKVKMYEAVSGQEYSIPKLQ